MHMFGVFPLHVDPFEAKYMVPRDPSLRACYRSSKIQRPKLSIHAAWCFGWVLRVVVLEEDTIHGSSMVHELGFFMLGGRDETMSGEAGDTTRYSRSGRRQHCEGIEEFMQPALLGAAGAAQPPQVFWPNCV